MLPHECAQITDRLSLLNDRPGSAAASWNRTEGDTGPRNCNIPRPAKRNNPPRRERPFLDQRANHEKADRLPPSVTVRDWPDVPWVPHSAGFGLLRSLPPLPCLSGNALTRRCRNTEMMNLRREEHPPHADRSGAPRPMLRAENRPPRFSLPRRLSNPPLRHSPRCDSQTTGQASVRPRRPPPPTAAAFRHSRRRSLPP
jgi:hypothetical protein